MRSWSRSVLATIVAIALLVSITAPLVSAAYVTAEWREKYGVAIVVLPEAVPEDENVTSAVLQFLSWLDDAVYSGKVVAYMIEERFVYKGTVIYPGSILLVYREPSVGDEIDSFSGLLNVVHVTSPIMVRVLTMPAPRILVWNGTGAYADLVLSALTALGFRYVVVNSTEALVTNLTTDKFDLIIVPHGDPSAIAQALGVNGTQAIIDFVGSGGGYVGIGGGAYLAAEGYDEYTSLMNLTALKVVNYPEMFIGVGKVEVEVYDPTLPVTYGFLGKLNVTYLEGPVLEKVPLSEFKPSGYKASTVATLVKFYNITSDFTPPSELNETYVAQVMDRHVAVAYSKFGKGKVVVFGIDPTVLGLVISDDDAAALGLKHGINYTVTPYVLRMVFNTVYFASARAAEKLFIYPMPEPGRKIFRGVWLWPSTARYYYVRLVNEYMEEHGIDDYTKIPVDVRYQLFLKAIEDLVADLQKLGVTDVFYEVKLLSGYILFPSEVAKKYGTLYTTSDPLKKDFYLEFDFLKHFVRVAHAHGIRVHAWLMVHYDRIWGKKYPIYHIGRMYTDNFTEYLTAEDYPVTSRVVLSAEEYIQYFKELVKELIVKEGVDGIHLDYIRYSHVVYSFDPITLTKAEERGINMTKVRYAIWKTYYAINEKDPTYVFRLYAYGDPDIRAWIEIKIEDVTNFVKEVKEAVEEAKALAGRSDIYLSAALMPDYVYYWEWALCHYGQDWMRLAEYLDIIIPMAYHREHFKPITIVYDEAVAAAFIADLTGAIPAVGIQAYPWTGSSWRDVYPTPEEVEKAETLAIAGGALGTVLFRFGTYKTIVELDELYRAVIEAAKTYEAMYPEAAAKLEPLIKAAHEYRHYPWYYSGIEAPLVSIYVPKLLETLTAITETIANLTGEKEIALLQKIEDIKLLLDQTKNALASSIEELKSNVSDLKESIEEITGTLDDLTSKVQANKENIQSVASDLRTAIEGLKSRIDEVENKACSVEKEAKNLGEKLATVTTYVYSALAVAVIALIIAIVALLKPVRKK